MSQLHTSGRKGNGCFSCPLLKEHTIVNTNNQSIFFYLKEKQNI